MLHNFLEDLANENIVKVAGSYARGEQTKNSDIDFLIKTPRHCILYQDRNENIDKLLRLLNKYGINWNSTRNSYISTIGEENVIETEMEFYEGFYHNKNKLKEVVIQGVRFKTF